MTTACLFWLAPGVGIASQLPDPLDDREFWRLVTELSEPDGFFEDENYLSNERGYQRVIPRLLDEPGEGGVYLGVGPEQNFTYIAALRPKIAFVIDIRHQNTIGHLMYKALFEMSADRADFVSRLFSRPRPPGLGTESTADELFGAYRSAPADPQLFEDNLAAILEVLTFRHGFSLTAGEEASLVKVLSAFYESGPDIMYVFQGTSEIHATYAQMMTTTDAEGTNRSYLATEENFDRVRGMQLRNLIVPVTGDFAGPKALRAVGEYVRDNGGTIGVFYVSNVEPYLFTDGTWRAFYENVGTLPVDASSLFVRTFFGGTARECRAERPVIMTPVLGSIVDFLEAYGDGEIESQCDLVTRSR